LNRVGIFPYGVLDGNIGFHANENSQVSSGNLPVDAVKAGKIEITDQKIKWVGSGDIDFQQFREEIVLIGDESGHSFSPLMILRKD
jgi:hypothetical protein